MCASYVKFHKMFLRQGHQKSLLHLVSILNAQMIILIIQTVKNRPENKMDIQKLKMINQQLAGILTSEAILGRVYQLYLKDQPESDLRYYGSTTRTIDTRFAQHKAAFIMRIKKGVTQGGTSSYKLFQKGLDKVGIRQLCCAIFPSLQDLRREEDKWVAQNSCANRNRPLQGLKEQINRQYYQKVIKPKKQKLKQIKKEEKILSHTQLLRKKQNIKNYQKNLLIILQCPMCYNSLPKAHMPQHKKRLCRNLKIVKKQQKLRQSKKDLDDEDMVKMQEEQCQSENGFQEDQEENYQDEDHQMPSDVKIETKEEE